ncbi:MAG: phosphatase PAP2 family protein [Saccharospirillaceae bacterium]|nr:hypothetical protein A3759_04240 [Thalassolituus sp. HI0120]MCH2041561.1 phosphatase PAP2 family protein [Saccharospirillaceae bacterium]
MLLKRHFDWISLIVLAALFLIWPEIDLAISNYFYDHETQQWPLKHHPVNTSIYALFRYMPHFLLPIMLICIGMTFVRNGISKQHRNPLLFLFLVLLIGPGLIVHGVFKEGFERPRPRQIQEFNGGSGFTPAFIVSDSCEKRCKSFVSGHAAMGFFFMALAWVFRSKRWFWFGIGLGVISSLVRIVQGGHFLSDTIFAGYVVYFTCVLLSAWLFHRRGIEGDSR